MAEYIVCSWKNLRMYKGTGKICFLVHYRVWRLNVPPYSDGRWETGM